MPHFHPNRLLPFVIILSALAGKCEAAIVLGSLFADHMVLQREMPIPIWGTAAAGEKVSVSLSTDVASTTADSGGTKMILNPLRGIGISTPIGESLRVAPRSRQLTRQSLRI